MVAKKFSLFAILLASLVSNPCWPEEIENEISGFTQDSTITRAGHEFARYLSDYRNANFSTGNDYNLVVFERPSARWGSLIWVTSDNQDVYRRFLPPGRIDIHK